MSAGCRRTISLVGFYDGLIFTLVPSTLVDRSSAAYGENGGEVSIRVELGAGIITTAAGCTGGGSQGREKL